MSEQGRGERGERGPTGDHGQTGSQGPRGATGAGVDHAETRRVSARIDRRLLILYGLLVVLLAAFLLYVQHSDAKIEANNAKFEKAVIENCEIGQANTKAFNSLIDQLIKSVQTNPAYSEADKKMRIEFFETGRQTVPTCPPVRVSDAFRSDE